MTTPADDTTSPSALPPKRPSNNPAGRPKSPRRKQVDLVKDLVPTIVGPKAQWDPEKTPLIPQPHGGALARGGTIGNRGSKVKNARKLVLQTVTEKLLGHIEAGIGNMDAGMFADRIRAGDQKALEAAARIFETLSDRAHGKPASVIQMPSGDDEGASSPKRVAFGAVIIEF